MEENKKEKSGGYGPMSWICNICKRVIMEDVEGDRCPSPGCKAYAKAREDGTLKPIKVKKVRKPRKKKEWLN